MWWRCGLRECPRLFELAVITADVIERVGKDLKRSHDHSARECNPPLTNLTNLLDPCHPWLILETGMCCPLTTLNTRRENNFWKTPTTKAVPCFEELSELGNSF
jgi:hypothetical protein